MYGFDKKWKQLENPNGSSINGQTELCGSAAGRNADDRAAWIIALNRLSPQRPQTSKCVGGWLWRNSNPKLIKVDWFRDGYKLHQAERLA